MAKFIEIMRRGTTTRISINIDHIVKVEEINDDNRKWCLLTLTSVFDGKKQTESVDMPLSQFLLNLPT
jgi:hypothetical protein